MWHSSELLFAFYLTEVCRMAPQTMGAVLAIALFASALMDIAVGHLLRRRTPSVHAAARVQSWGACGAGLAFFLFLAIGLFFERQHAALALAIGLAFRLAYAFYDVPQNAILGMVAGDDRLRASLSSLRFVCSGVASLIVATAASVLLAGGRQSQGFAILGAIVGAIAIGTSLWFLWVSRTSAARGPASDLQPIPAARAPVAMPPARRELALLLGLAFVVSVSAVIFTKLEPYFAAYILATQGARATLLAAVACGGIASQLFALWSASRWTVPLAFGACALLTIIGALAFVALGARATAWTPVSAFLIGFGLQGLGMLLWTAVANLTAGSARSAAPLAPTVVFGLLTFSQKTASALGTLAIGSLLGAYQADGAAANSHSPIALAMGMLPLASAIVCLMFARKLKHFG